MYGPQCGLSDVLKDKFYDQLLSVISTLPHDNLLVGGDFNGHVGKNADSYEGTHGGCGYGLRNNEGERILELRLAMNMVVTNSFFMKRDSRLITSQEIIGVRLITSCSRENILKGGRVLRSFNVKNASHSISCWFVISPLKHAPLNQRCPSQGGVFMEAQKC